MQNPYFNIDARALPDQYTITPEPPVLGELQAPAQKDLNLSGYKYFPVTERVRLIVSAEFDQVTNAPLFNAPGTNMSRPATFGVITGDHGGRGAKMCLRLWF